MFLISALLEKAMRRDFGSLMARGALYVVSDVPPDLKGPCRLALVPSVFYSLAASIIAL